MNDINQILPHVQLRFNLEHPTLEECYAYGYECGRSDISEQDNPFKENSTDSEQWLEGWWAGFYGEIPLYELSKLTQTQKTEVAAANDQVFVDGKANFLKKVLEITGVIAVSTILGYQVIDFVA